MNHDLLPTMVFHQTPPPVDTQIVLHHQIRRRSAESWPSNQYVTPVRMPDGHSRLPTSIELLIPFLETPGLQGHKVMENMTDSSEALILPSIKKPRKRFVLQPRRTTNNISSLDLETFAFPAKRHCPPSFVSLDHEIKKHIDLGKDSDSRREEERKAPVVVPDATDTQSSSHVYSDLKDVNDGSSFPSVSKGTKDAMGLIALPYVIRPTTRGDVAVLASQTQGSTNIHSTLVPSRSSAFMPAGRAA